MKNAITLSNCHTALIFGFYLLGLFFKRNIMFILCLNLGIFFVVDSVSIQLEYYLIQLAGCVESFTVVDSLFHATCQFKKIIGIHHSKTHQTKQWHGKMILLHHLEILN